MEMFIQIFNISCCCFILRIFNVEISITKCIEKYTKNIITSKICLVVYLSKFGDVLRVKKYIKIWLLLRDRFSYHFQREFYVKTSNM